MRRFDGSPQTDSSTRRCSCFVVARPEAHIYDPGDHLRQTVKWRLLRQLRISPSQAVTHLGCGSGVWHGFHGVHPGDFDTRHFQDRLIVSAVPTPSLSSQWFG